MKPLRDYILVKTSGETVTTGGIVLPDDSKAGDLFARGPSLN